MALIYRKTAKGVAEIETRAHRLTPRLRSALIVVDGRRSDAELHALVLQQPVEAFAALVEQGFIERVESGHRVNAGAAGFAAVAGSAAGGANQSASATAPPAARPDGPGASPLAPTATAAPALEFPSTRRDAVRQLSDLVGPACEGLAMRMEKARTPEELRPLLALAAQSVANMRGKQAATLYAQRFQDV